MKHLLLTLIFLSSFFASAQIVNIPDANFKNALLNHNPVIDTNGDGEIQVSEAEAVSVLNLYNKNISDLTGVEAFANIYRLDCHVNLLTQLDISENIELLYLDVSVNSLSTLDLTNNLQLIDLDCSDNQFTSLDISNNSSLTDLYCERNMLTSLNISQNPSLINLSCGQNPLSSLDVSQNLNLEFLNVYTTQLSDIDVSNNINLIDLNLSDNQLTSLDVSQIPNLDALSFLANEISNINVSNNPVLRVLQCKDNQLTNIDVSQNPELVILTCGDNPITSLDVSQNAILKGIEFSNTLISEIDLSNNPLLCGVEGNNNFSLNYVNIKNGDNPQLIISNCFARNFMDSSLNLLNNPNLQFVCVDDANFAAANFPEVAPNATFIDNCTIANGDLNHITGTVKYDDENNGCDGGDAGIDGLLVNTTDGTNNFATTTINTGDYNLTVAENTYTTTVLGLSPYFTLSPAQAVDTFVGFNQTEVADFCIAPATTANDLAVTFVPLTAARPGFEVIYKLVYENVGTTQLSGNVELDFDGTLVTFVEATPTETSLNGNTISWDYSNLNPFETRTIEVIFEVAQPPIVEEGDVLPYIARVNPVSGDAAPDDNVFQLNQIAVNSFDPNDKQVLEGYQVLIENADEYLHYVVRFQNMGTASAINVRVQDSLDEKLDWTTLKVLDASHAMETQLVNGSIDFIFDDINLPTATSDPEGSQGFVAFKVKPLPTVQLDDVVANKADIYFDFNAAIVTNTVYTRFVEELGVSEFETLKIFAYPNPASDILNIQAEASISSIEIMNVLGQTLLTAKGNSNREQVDVSGLSAGNYFVRVVVGDGSRVLRVVKK
ncbi:T9SS type A sorting domain-containing protein [Aequorivita viscosa]|nr:T9SS type A sorting domain-containing protein [Aequorivita viscosa]